MTCGSSKLPEADAVTPVVRELAVRERLLDAAVQLREQVAPGGARHQAAGGRLQDPVQLVPRRNDLGRRRRPDGSRRCRPSSRRDGRRDLRRRRRRPRRRGCPGSESARTPRRRSGRRGGRRRTRSASRPRGVPPTAPPQTARSRWRPARPPARPPSAPSSTAGTRRRYATSSSASLRSLILASSPAAETSSAPTSRRQPLLGARHLGGETDAARRAATTSSPATTGTRLPERVEVETEPALTVRQHLVRERELPRNRRLVERDDERALPVSSHDHRRRAAEVARVAGEVIDVVGTEDDGAVESGFRQPGGQSLERAWDKRGWRRSSHLVSVELFSMGSCRRCSHRDGDLGGEYRGSATGRAARRAPTRRGPRRARDPRAGQREVRTPCLRRDGSPQRRPRARTRARSCGPEPSSRPRP